MRSIVWDLGRKISTPLHSAQDDTKQPLSAQNNEKNIPLVSKFLKERGCGGKKSFFQKVFFPPYINHYLIYSSSAGIRIRE